MSAYISTDLNMVKELDPRRHELALLQDEFLNKGGTIQELIPFTYVPPPIRHEPPPRKKVAKAKPAPKAEIPFCRDKRENERRERAIQRAKGKIELIARIRKLAETMTYSQAMVSTGMSRKVLYSIAKEAGFSFQPAAFTPNLPRTTIDEAKDASNAERIKAFKELGLTRNQAMEKTGISFSAFTRILAKYEIDFPKTGRGGPRPAFFPKTPK